MKRIRIFFLSIFLCTLCFSSLDAEWGDVVHIGSAQNDLDEYMVSMSRSGRAVAAWVDSQGVNSVLRTAIWDGIRWVETDLLVEDSTGAQTVSAGIDDSGNVIAVWKVGNIIYASRYSPSVGWNESRTALYSGEDIPSFGPAVGVSSNGTAVAMWSDENDDEDLSTVYGAVFDGVSWGILTTFGAHVGSVSEYSAALNASGNGSIVWTYSGRTYVRRYVSGTFVDAVSFDNLEGGDLPVSNVINDTGDILIVGVNGGSNNLRYAWYTGGEWDEGGEDITTNFAYGSLSNDGQGIITTVDNDTAELKAALIQDGFVGPFEAINGSVELLSPFVVNFNASFGSNEGLAIFAFGDDNLYSTSVSEEGWTPPTEINGESAVYSYEVFSYTPNGFAITVWPDGNDRLFAAVFGAESPIAVVQPIVVSLKNGMHVTWMGGGSGTVNIYDVTGTNLLATTNASEGALTLRSIGYKPQGAYIIQVTNGSGQVVSEQVIQVQ